MFNRSLARTKWWISKAAKLLGFAFLAYILVLVVGLLPVNRDFVAPSDGVTIYLTSNAVHADIIVPLKTETINWRSELAGTDFLGDVAGKSHVAFGWGDRGFYLETPTWSDLNAATAARALLWPSETCIHVDFTHPESYGNAAFQVVITEEQYENLAQFIRNSFVVRENAYRQIEGYQYSFTDAFFEAQGSYHLLNTCNSWVGNALKAAGIKVPWLSPMPKTPMMYLPKAQNTARS